MDVEDKDQNPDPEETEFCHKLNFEVQPLGEFSICGCFWCPDPTQACFDFNDDFTNDRHDCTLKVCEDGLAKVRAMGYECWD